MDQLQTYIQEQRDAGYSDEQIAQALLQNGYDQSTVDAALHQEAVHQGAGANVQSTAVVPQVDNNQLQQYILTYLQQGYNAQQLYNYLKGQGYSPIQLKAAFSAVDKQYYQGQLPLEVIHHHTVGTGAVVKVGAMLLVLVLLGGGFMLFGQDLLDGQGSVILDLKTIPTKTDIKVGEPLVFKVQMVNQGETKNTNINFLYEIRDKSTELLVQEEETMAFATTLQNLVEIDLPTDLPTGQYEVTTTASYAKGVDIAKFVFTLTEVGQEPVPLPEIVTVTCYYCDGTQLKSMTTQGTCPDATTISKPDCGEEEGEELPKEKVKVSDLANDQTIFSQAMDASRASTAQAYCLEIKDEVYQTECLSVVAQRTSTPAVCESITSVQRKEDCYMNFILSGDTSHCNKITLPENIPLCQQFIQLDLINSYLQTGDEEAKEQLGIKDPTPVDVENQPDPTLDDFFIGDVVEET